MFIVLLKFSDNRENAGKYMESHKDWLKQGFANSIFVLSGSLQDKSGGGIVASGISFHDLQQVVATDPFVMAGVVKAEIIELTPSKAIPALEFLMN